MNTKLLNTILISTLIICSYAINLKSKAIIDTSTTYALRNKGSTKCLTYTGEATSHVSHKPCNLYMSGNFWKFSYNAEGWYSINNEAAPTKYISNWGVSLDNGAAINSWEWKNQTNQQWYLDSVDGTYYLLRLKLSQKCVTPVEVDHFAQYDCDRNNANQLFKLETKPVFAHDTIESGVGYMLVNKGTSKCLRHSGNASSYTAHLDCNPYGPMSYFKFEAQSGGAYAISTLAIANGYLSNWGVSAANGALLNVWGWAAQTNQRWYVDWVDANYFMLRLEVGQKCAIPADVQANGFMQYDCDPTNPNQLFRLGRKPADFAHDVITPGTQYGLIVKGTYKCMNYYGGESSVAHTDCNAADKKSYWTFAPQPNGSYAINSASATVQYLSNYGVTAENGGRINNWGWANQINQRFFVDWVDAHYFMLRIEIGSKCVTVDGDWFAQYDCIHSNENQLFRISTSPSSVRGYMISGLLKHASTGLALSSTALAGASVTFASSTGQTFLANINSDGSYTAQLPTGTYTGTAKATGFVNSTNAVNMGTSDMIQNFVLSPVTTDKSARIVLTWGGQLLDMDLYLFNTATNKYANYQYKLVDYMKFEVDQTKGFGPETIQLAAGATDKYRVVVKRFSKEIPITSSGAKVDVIRDGATIYSISIPTTNPAANAWDVLYYNAATGQIEVINNLS
jgi:hypothetical protein